MAAMFRYEFIALHSVPRAIAVKKELLLDTSNNNAQNEEARSHRPGFSILTTFNFRLRTTCLARIRIIQRARHVGTLLIVIRCSWSVVLDCLLCFCCNRCKSSLARNYCIWFSYCLSSLLSHCSFVKCELDRISSFS